MPFDYTGSFSGSFTGGITSTNGVISSSAQVSYTQIRNKPTTISAFQANSILANTNFRETSFVNHSSSVAEQIVTLNTGVAAATQTLGLVGNTLSISNGNSVSLANLGAGAGGTTIWSTGSQDPLSYTYLESQNNLQLTGSLRVSGGVTASLFGTAATASYVSDTFISASVARSGFGQSNPFPYTGSASISGSLQITGSLDLLYNGVNAFRIQGDDGIEVVRSSGVFPTTTGGHLFPGGQTTLYARNGTQLGPSGQSTFMLSGYNTHTSIGLNNPSDGTVLFISGSSNSVWVGYGTSARDGKLWVRDYLNVEGQISASGGISGSSLWLNGIGDVSASLASAIAASLGAVFPYVGNAQITGSLKITNVMKVGDLSSTTLPTAEAGMIAYSASAFYFGIV
jgi:hypothetical protein